MGHSHGHKGPLLSSSETRRQRSIFRRIGSNIKSVDGIDEFATLAGQLFPGIGQHIATLAILVPATPFVWMGVLGMKEEYEEARNAYREILESERETKKKLQALATHSAEWCARINRRCGLNLSFETPASSDETPGTVDDYAEQIVKYQSLQADKLLTAMERKYGWTGLVGMSGMFVGMLAAIADSSAEIAAAASSTIETSATAAASALSAVAGGFFLVGQVAMSAYAGNKARMGHKQIKRLHTQKETLTTTGIDPHINEILDREITYIKKHSTRYGKATIFGQACMASGTIAGLSGAGLAVTLPLFAIGAPATIIPAIHRIITEKREANFKGKGDLQYVHDVLEHFNPLDLINKHETEENPYKAAREEVAQTFTPTIEQLAIVKSLSLLHHTANSRRAKNKTPEEQFAHIRKRIRDASIKRSQLETSVTRQVGALMDEHKTTITKLLKLPTEELNTRLANASLYCLEASSAKDVLNYLNSPTQEFKKLIKDIGLSGEFPNRGNKKDSRTIIRSAKSALKAIRFGLAHAITDINAIEMMAKDIRLEQEQQPKPPVANYSPPSAAGAASSSKDNTHRTFDEAFNCFKVRITRDYPHHTRLADTEKLIKDSEEIDELRAQAKRENREFILRNPPKILHGKTIYTWRDPRPAYGEDTSADVVYVVDNKTGATEVKYHENANAILLCDPDMKKGQGARIFSIQNGTCTSHGHSANTRYGTPEPARHTGKIPTSSHTSHATPQESNPASLQR
jgi:hypothetical protein